MNAIRERACAKSESYWPDTMNHTPAHINSLRKAWADGYCAAIQEERRRTQALHLALAAIRDQLAKIEELRNY